MNRAQIVCLVRELEQQRDAHREHAETERARAQQAETKAEECAKQLWAMVCDDTGCEADVAERWLEAHGYVAHSEWRQGPQPGDLGEIEP